MMHAEEILNHIKTPKWDRIFRIKDALMMGVSVNTIAKATHIDRWFLYEIQKICSIEKEIAKYDLDTLPIELLKEAKVNGFSDDQISRVLQHFDEEDVYQKRKAAGITRVYKMVDTCSAEFEAKTPYFYSTFEDGPLQTSPGAGGSATNESTLASKR